MNKLISLTLSIAFFLSSLPSSAIDEDTYVLPIIGPATENANDYVKEKIELATIKLLPKKVFNVEIPEPERTFTFRFVRDHFGLWTSPIRTQYKDLKWLLPASGALTALFLTDNDFSGALTNNNKPTKLQRDISNAFGQIGGYAPTLGVPGGVIAVGYLTKNDHLRETGVLQYQAIAHATLLFVITSAIAGRNKPNNHKKGGGEFFEGSTSFPSGHTLNAFASASVLAHEYPDKLWVPVTAYTLASLLAASRVTQGLHFPSDVFAAAVAGILIGRYVVKHNSQYAPVAKSKLKKEQDKQ